MPDPVTIPPDVLIAASEAVHAETCKCGGSFHEADTVAALMALEAAAPAIRARAAAGERERIRQLAVNHDAAITKDCTCGPHHGGRFAGLLGEDDSDGSV